MAFGALVVPLVMGAGGGVVAYVEGLSITAIYIAVIVSIMVGVAIVAAIPGIQREYGTFQNLVISGIYSPGAALEVGQGNPTFTHLTLQAKLANKGQRRIFCKIVRAYVSVGNVTRQDANIRDEIILIYGNDDSLITFGTLHNVEIVDQRLEGRIDLEILYGPREDRLIYSLSYEGAPAFAMSNTGPNGSPQLNTLTSNLKSEHKRA